MLGAHRHKGRHTGLRGPGGECAPEQPRAGRERERTPRPHERVRAPERRRQQVGIAQRVGKRPRRHRRRSALRPDRRARGARYSQVVTAGALPNARLDGNCGKRRKAMVSTSVASIRARRPRVPAPVGAGRRVAGKREQAGAGLLERRGRHQSRLVLEQVVAGGLRLAERALGGEEIRERDGGEQRGSSPRAPAGSSRARAGRRR